MFDMNSLNDRQRQAVSKTTGPLMILAGAGTGKTRVISCRIAHMISLGFDPNHIVALTFTNKAAREMAERVRDLVGSPARKITVGTFHSFCIKILKHYGHLIGLSRNFTLIGTSDQIDLVRKALEEKGWTGTRKPEDLLMEISNLKNQLIKPEDFSERLVDIMRISDSADYLQEIYGLYEQQLRYNHAIDFDDCIFKVVELLKKHEDARLQIQKQFQHVLVDEYQDTNFSQLEVLRLLVDPNKKNICVVGDDDQSIYSWRGAMAEILDRFEDYFPGTTLIKLEQNYRCSQKILDCANTVIKNNKSRKDKTLWSKAQVETPIEVHCLKDDIEESKFVSKQIYGLLAKDYQPSDIGILYRANGQARTIETALREFNISYKIFGGSSFFEKKEIKDFIGYLKLISNRQDRISFWRVVNTPARGLGIKSLEVLDQFAKEKDLSPFAAAEKIPVEQITPRAYDSLQKFCQEIKGFDPSESLTPASAKLLCEAILTKFPLEKEIRQKTKNPASCIRKLQNLKSVPNWISKLTESLLLTQEKVKLKDIIEAITLNDAPDSKEKDVGNYVSCMTIHASKGLEFRVVFIVGLEEDLLPHKNSLQEFHGLSEERRLFYVAITRAKQKLVISHSLRRQTGFHSEDRKVSRFIDELPGTTGVVLHSDNMPELTEEDKKQVAMKGLADLKASLFKL